MGNIGVPELLIILVIALLFFGPKKLPDFARSLGQAIREFRRASQAIVDDFQRAATEDPAPAKSTHTDTESFDMASSDPSHEPERDPEPAPATKQL